MRTSGENLFDVLFVIASSSQELGPPANPGRFSPFGFVEAYKEKRAAITPWLSDASPKVRAFAQSYIKGIDLRIASEQRSAEQQHEIRKLDWNDPEADGDAT